MPHFHKWGRCRHCRPVGSGLTDPPYRRYHNRRRARSVASHNLDSDCSRWTLELPLRNTGVFVHCSTLQRKRCHIPKRNPEDRSRHLPKVHSSRFHSHRSRLHTRKGMDSKYRHHYNNHYCRSRYHRTNTHRPECRHTSRHMNWPGPELEGSAMQLQPTEVFAQIDLAHHTSNFGAGIIRDLRVADQII